MADSYLKRYKEEVAQKSGRALSELTGDLRQRGFNVGIEDRGAGTLDLRVFLAVYQADVSPFMGKTIIKKEEILPIHHFISRIRLELS